MALYTAVYDTGFAPIIFVFYSHKKNNKKFPNFYHQHNSYSYNHKQEAQVLC